MNSNHMPKPIFPYKQDLYKLVTLLCFESNNNAFGMEKHVSIVLNLEAFLKVHSKDWYLCSANKQKTFQPLYEYSSEANNRFLISKRV